MRTVLTILATCLLAIPATAVAATSPPSSGSWRAIVTVDGWDGSILYVMTPKGDAALRVTSATRVRDAAGARVPRGDYGHGFAATRTVRIHARAQPRSRWISIDGEPQRLRTFRAVTITLLQVP